MTAFVARINLFLLALLLFYYLVITTNKRDPKYYGTVAIGIMIETEPCYNSAV